jgi:hypothetical protein
MYHLFIVFVFLNNPAVPAMEKEAQTFTNLTVCQAAGDMRTSQLNQDRNQVTGYVCLKF